MTNKLEEDRKIEYFIAWLNPLIEIMNTKYFKTAYFDDTKSEYIKNIIDYIDYLEHAIEIKQKYSKIYFYLPELKKSFTEAYKNKLIVEEAELALR